MNHCQPLRVLSTGRNLHAKKEVGTVKEEVEKAEEAGQEAILGALREEELLVGIRDQIWGVQNGGRMICISQIPF